MMDMQDKIEKAINAYSSGDECTLSTRIRLALAEYEKKSEAFDIYVETGRMPENTTIKDRMMKYEKKVNHG